MEEAGVSNRELARWLGVTEGGGAAAAQLQASLAHRLARDGARCAGKRLVVDVQDAA